MCSVDLVNIWHLGELAELLEVVLMSQGVALPSAPLPAGVAGCTVREAVTFVSHFVGLSVIHTPAELLGPVTDPETSQEEQFLGLGCLVNQYQMRCCSKHVYLCSGCTPQPSMVHCLDSVLLFRLCFLCLNFTLLL